MHEWIRRKRLEWKELVETLSDIQGVEYLAVLLVLMCVISALKLAGLANAKGYYENTLEVGTIDKKYGVNEEEKGFELAYILERRKDETENELQEYKLPDGKDLMELQFSPVRSVIMSTWRSGSTFLGDILDSHPANFYYYEPLAFLDMERYEREIHKLDVTKFLESLFKCNLTGTTAESMLKKTYLFHHMKRVWEHCHGNLRLCQDPQFLASLCRLLPFQSMKIVRLPLKEIDGLLLNERLGVRVVYLVRDPRGTMASRLRRSWCKTSVECNDPNILCRQIEDDYHTATYFMRTFPSTFKIVRYEDIALDVNKTVTDILHFFQRNVSKQTQRYIASHTIKSKGGLYDTYRDSKKVATQWMNKLKLYQIREIQASCEHVMQLYGYRQLQQNQSVQTFNPLAEFSIAPARVR